MQYKVEKTSTIHLGKQGENLARKLVFAETADWENRFGPGAARIIYLPPGAKAPVSILLEQTEEGAWSWAVTAADTARAGYGRCELQYVAGDIVVKSVSRTTYVAESLDRGDPVPEQGYGEGQQGDEPALSLIDRESGVSYDLIVESGKLMLEEV